jgi:hypothetical protein
MVLTKPEILRILDAILDMKGQGYIIKNIFSNEGIVLFEIVEEGLFIA